MQTGLFPEIPPSNDCEKLVPAINVFAIFLFAHAKTNQDIPTIAKIIMNIMTKFLYLPTTLISKKGSALVSQVIKVVLYVLGITLEQSTTKHAETIGMLEKTHVSFVEVLQNETGERGLIWLESVNTPVPIKNTCYNTSTGCELSPLFIGRVPHNVLELRRAMRSQKPAKASLQIDQGSNA